MFFCFFLGCQLGVSRRSSSERNFSNQPEISKLDTIIVKFTKIVNSLSVLFFNEHQATFLLYIAARTLWENGKSCFAPPLLRVLVSAGSLYGVFFVQRIRQYVKIAKFSSIRGCIATDGGALVRSCAEHLSQKPQNNRLFARGQSLYRGRWML